MLQLIRGTRRRRKAGSTKQLGQLQLFATGNQNTEITEKKIEPKVPDASNRGSGPAPALLPFYLSEMKPLSEMSSGRRD